MGEHVLLDACVLTPFPLFDTLLRLADARIVTPVWSPQILAEVERTLVRDLGRTPTEAADRIASMTRAFADASVTPDQALIDAMRNHPKDRHVLAAAVEAGAPTIVTANLKDFPPAALTEHGVTAVHPDQFLLDQMVATPDAVIAVLRAQRAAYTNPAFTLVEFYETFAPTVPRFAQAALTAEQQDGTEGVRDDQGRTQGSEPARAQSDNEPSE
jgi:predicted nucleic acid-binding protein